MTGGRRVTSRPLGVAGTALALLLAGPLLARPLDQGPALPRAPGLASVGLAAQGQQDLNATAAGLGRAWAGGSDQVVAAHLVEGRVRLHLDGGVSATLPTRQAIAALREYLRGYEAGEVEVARVALVEGSGERGFAELRWTARRAGTSQPLRRTVFLGFRHEGRSWAVEEVRVMH